MSPTRRGVFLYALGIITGFAVTSFSSNYNYMSKMPFSLYKTGPREAYAFNQAVLSHEALDALPGPRDIIKFKDKHLHKDNDSIAKQLHDQIRVLCWVMTSLANLQKKARHVRATWGHRCNKLLFVSDHKDEQFPTIDITVQEGRDHLTAKTMKAFDYIYKYHYDDADWFMKVDDDTYVIVENLRYFLSSQNSSEPIYFGHRFKPYVPQGYYSGGGGYVFSQEALRRFGTRAPGKCSKDSGAEDVEVGKCMYNLGVKTSDSRDVLGRSRFHCFDPSMHIQGSYPDWYYRYDAYGAKKGINSISDYAITFHYIPPDRMYELEFVIYHLAPYGIVGGLQLLNGVPPSTSPTDRPSPTTLGVTSSATTTAKTKPISPSAQPAKNSRSNSNLSKTTTHPAKIDIGSNGNLSKTTTRSAKIDIIKNGSS